MLFSIQSAQSVRVFTSLSSIQPKWSHLGFYYKIKISVGVIWLIEISLVFAILSLHDYNLYSYLDTVVMCYSGCILDFYFAYCLYSCRVLGELGLVRRRTVPDQRPIETQSNQIYVAQELKQITAYPTQKILPQCEYIIVTDFTSKITDNNDKPENE